MNANRLINMLMHRLMRRGVSACIDYAARRGKSKDQITPPERQAARCHGQTARRAQRTLRQLRRFMRF